MKKILLASTALVVSAGFAAAEVSLGGSAEIGIKDNGDEVVFHNDLDVRFTLSSVADNGLTFGATIDLDEVGDGIDAEKNSAAVFLSGSFGTITMGDTDGAFDWALTEVGSGSAIADDHTAHAGYSGNGGLDGAHDGQVLRWNYSFGNFGVAVSAELNDLGVVAVPANDAITIASGLPGAVVVPDALTALTALTVNDDPDAGPTITADEVTTRDAEIVTRNAAIVTRDAVRAGAELLNAGAVDAANTGAVDAANNTNRLAAAKDVFSIGTTYAMDVGSGSVGFGLGYQSGGRTADRTGAVAVLNDNTFGLSISGNFGGGFSGVLNYSKGDGTAAKNNNDVILVAAVEAVEAADLIPADGDTPEVPMVIGVDAVDAVTRLAGDRVDVTHMGIGLAYQLDALLLHANYGVNEVDGEKSTGWGLAANYALGGGASAQFGYGNGEGKSTWSLGLAMSF